MRNLFVKYCGFTRREDVDYAVGLGVNALGFMFYSRSPRWLDPQKASELTQDVPDSVTKTGIFVAESVDTINAVAEKASLDYIQLFEHEINSSARYVCPVIPVYRVSCGEDLARVDWSRTLILDSYSPVVAGGSGKRFDWELLAADEMREKIRQHAVIAGGVDANNLSDLLDTVVPFGIDLSSGIEREKGVKSKQKMKQLMEIVEAWKNG